MFLDLSQKVDRGLRVLIRRFDSSRDKLLKRLFISVISFLVNCEFPLWVNRVAVLYFNSKLF